MTFYVTNILASQLQNGDLPGCG